MTKMMNYQRNSETEIVETWYLYKLIVKIGEPEILLFRFYAIHEWNFEEWKNRIFLARENKVKIEIYPHNIMAQ